MFLWQRRYQPLGEDVVHSQPVGVLERRADERQVQRPSADLAGQLARAEFTAAAAKAQASDSIAEITRIAHQLHGAIGFTAFHYCA